MSIKLGNISITNLAENKVENAHTLLDFKWTDHILNDVSWLRADTFSWHSGLVYIGAYQHLVDDIASITPETETIGSYTITFYRALDGHKIVLPDQIDTLQSIYETDGIAWYYILDTTNTRFKLPRTKFGFVGYRDEVGKFVDESLPNIKGTMGLNSGQGFPTLSNSTGAFYNTTTSYNRGTQNVASSGSNLNFDASRSSSTYQDNAPVQERATQMYLYFYVGEFTQTALQQTAGITTAQLNNKIDIDHTNDTKPYLKECYVNGTSGYNIWSNGYCEQWGITNYIAWNGGGGSQTVTFLKQMLNANYNKSATMLEHTANWNTPGCLISSNSTSSMVVGIATAGPDQGSARCSWVIRGYLAEGEY